LNAGVKVLLDTCVWGGAIKILQEQGHDVVWTGAWEIDPGDREIMRHARDAGRILVTLDKDFGERAIVMGEPHAGIIRLVGIPAREQGRACGEALGRYGAELENGAIVTVGPSKIRIRPGG